MFTDSPMKEHGPMDGFHTTFYTTTFYRVLSWAKVQLELLEEHEERHHVLLPGPVLLPGVF